MREIALHDTHSVNGQVHANDPVRVYDTSGPWGDPEFTGLVTEGLPATRDSWIHSRGDVEAYEGREVRPGDNGYLSSKHAESAAESRADAALKPFPGLKRKSLRASKEHPVTQLWYARQGIVTPEMEFIAIRENMGRAKMAEESRTSNQTSLELSLIHI